MADDFYKWFSERRLTRFGGARRLRIERGRLALLARHATPPGDLLEIGPGVGSLVEPLGAMGWTYRAIEASPTLAGQLRARGVEVTEAWVPPFPVADACCDVAVRRPGARAHERHRRGPRLRVRGVPRAAARTASRSSSCPTT